MIKLIFLALFAALALAQERSVNDLREVCAAFDNMEQSAPAQLLQQLGGQISTPDIDTIRGRCGRTQFHIGMVFGKEDE